MYFPLRVHSHYSLLLSTLKPEDIIEQAKKREYKAVGLTDYANIGGAISFFKACKKAGIKALLGCELVITDNPDVEIGTITLICKNVKGWKTLLNIVSRTNDVENFKKIPTIGLSELESFDLTNFICIDGYEGSLFHQNLFEDMRSGYFIEDYNELAESCLDRHWMEKGIEYIADMKSRFGEDYYVECISEECCSETNPLPLLVSKCVGDIAKRAGVKVLLDNPIYYNDNTGAADQRILLCSRLKCTISSLDNRIKNGSLLDAKLNIFLKSSFYKFNDLESTNHQEIFDKVESFDILSQPKLPKFECPNGLSEIEYLKQLCRNGWRDILIPSGVLSSDEQRQTYKDRVLYELDVIERANLAGYFLIVQDYVNEFRKRGVLVGCGRGSAAGCLVSYLLGITLIDPILYKLLFNRFYNAGRISPGKISLPDIDVDFPPEVRDDVISYLKEKYGQDKVGQMATYGRLQGRSALKEVLRVNEYCSFEEMNNITSILPQEGAISDQLEEMEEHSIILWALENESTKLKDYCYLENGELHGDYARAFAQAMRIEGTYKTIGKHAAAVIVSSEPLHDFCPMIKGSRSSDKILGFDMKSSEDAGAVKMDILAVAILSKIHNTCQD